MSRPRPVYKNVTLMLTRRVRGRKFLLKPGKETNQVVGYVVAVMLKKWNMKLVAKIVMGNHWHLVLTDRDGKIVEFQRDCHQFIARALNVKFGDEENFWNTSQSSRVECAQPSDTIQKIAYVMANPVEGRLVREGRLWPGLRMCWPHRPMVFKRPAWFFRGIEDGGDWPEEATLELSRPPGYDDLSDEELAAVIERAIYEREETFRNQYDAAGKKFLGRRAILRQARHSSPRSRAKRGGISPTLACGDKWLRIERLKQNRDWLDDHAAALARWRAGDRTVRFPHGTYKMRVLHGARCAGPPM